MSKKAKENIICILAGLLVCLIGFIYMSATGRIELYTATQQYAQVEVVETRIERHAGIGRGSSYIVAFEFPDGSVREFNLLGFGRRRTFNSIQVGDTGILTFREQSNIEEITSPGMRRSARRFVSFERTAADSGE